MLLAKRMGLPKFRKEFDEIACNFSVLSTKGKDTFSTV